MEIEQSKSFLENERLKEMVEKALRIIQRWLYGILIFFVIIFSYFIWNKYLQNAEWGEERKNQYINEQAVLKFDKDKFQKALDVFDSKAENLKKGEVILQNDIFFP